MAKFITRVNSERGPDRDGRDECVQDRQPTDDEKERPSGFYDGGRGCRIGNCEQDAERNSEPMEAPAVR